MSYLVLARKWRPQSFDDLVGQGHVSRTLANAIAQDRVAHAFLFTGVRGVGKTTSARILAKALNCMGRPGGAPNTGPTATPCLECSACIEIGAGTDLDVREIDGASYNGVDEIRKLQDGLAYRPARDRYKIYVVDEVHMLSQAAWNAFLKTLEEPPPHVKFIFATTEAHKIPVTILSRVQRFDFKLIPTQLIAERIRHVLAKERIQADDAAIAIVAREAAGSLRDAMSLLDQVIAWGGERLSSDGVARVLGVASHQVLHDLAGALLGGDAVRCLEIVASLAQQGFDIPHVARDVLALLRDLVVAKVCREPGELIDLADEEKRDVMKLAASTDADDVLRLHQGFSQAYDEVVRGAQPRAALEMLLVRLARRPPLVPLDELIGRLGALERRLGGSGSPAPAGRAGAEPAPRPASQARSAPREARARESAQRTPSEPADEPPPASPAAAAPEPAGANGTHGAWRALLDRIRVTHPDLAAILGHAAPLEVGPERLRLAYPRDSVFERTATAQETRAVLERAAAAELGGHPTLSIEIGAPAVQPETVAAQDARERDRRQSQALEAARRHPIVQAAVEILGRASRT